MSTTLQNSSTRDSTMRSEPVGPVRDAPPAIARGGSGPDAYAYNDDELSLWTIAALLLRKGRVAAIVAAVVILVGVPYTLLTGNLPVTYTANASFVPEGGGGGAPSGLAARLGLGGGGGGAGGMSFYSSLIHSRTLLGTMINNRYRAPTDSGTFELPVTHIAGAAGQSEGAQRNAAIVWLRSRIQASPDASAGVMQLTARTGDPETSRRVLEDLLKAIQEYNISVRQNNASIERRFVENRLAALQAELRAAEAQLASFLRENRQYANSPELVIAYERLSRERSLKQDIVNNLAKNFEQVRIDEVRNTPVISIFEAPETPLRPDPQPGKAGRVLWVVILAAILGVVAALVTALLDWARMNGGPAYRQFNATVLEIRRGAARVLPARLRRSGS